MITAVVWTSDLRRIALKLQEEGLLGEPLFARMSLPAHFQVHGRFFANPAMESRLAWHTETVLKGGRT